MDGPSVKKHRRTFSIRSMAEMFSTEPIKGPTVVRAATKVSEEENGVKAQGKTKRFSSLFKSIDMQ